LILAQAEYFEGIIRKWVMENMPSPAVQNICVSTGNTQESLDELSAWNVSCIPSVANYPAIDSAVVVNSTLYGFQMAVSENKDMNKLNTNFRDKVLPIFRSKLSGLSAAVVFIVVPKGTGMKCPPEDDSDDIYVKFKIHEVDVAIDGLTTTMQALFEQIQLGKV
jgi:hypothetical protein